MATAPLIVTAASQRVLPVPARCATAKAVGIVKRAMPTNQSRRSGEESATADDLGRLRSAGWMPAAAIKM